MSKPRVKNGRVQAITRLVVTAVLFINAILTAKGINPIPIDEGTVEEVIADIALGISTVWTWWRNNNISENALYWQKRKEDAEVFEKAVRKK